MTGELINVRITKRRMTASPSAEGWQPSAARVSATQHRGTHLSRRAIPIIVGTALVAMSLAVTPGHAFPPGGMFGAPGPSSADDYSLAVTGICIGALLFEGSHEMGTRSHALEIAEAIRASTAGRLARVTALSVPPELQDTSSRWVSSQRSLASLYARLWVRIYDTIDAAHTAAERATLGKRLKKLLHAPDALKRAARRLELELHVPDCTGGG